MRRTKNLKVLLTTAMVALLPVACSDSSSNDSPTAPNEPLFFSGTVGDDIEGDHDFTMPDDGLVSVIVTDLDIVLFDTSLLSPDSILVGLGLGQRDEEGECDLTSNFAVAEDQVTVFRLSADNYCLTMFDSGSFPEDSILNYAIEATFTL